MTFLAAFGGRAAFCDPLYSLRCPVSDRRPLGSPTCDRSRHSNRTAPSHRAITSHDRLCRGSTGSAGDKAVGRIPQSRRPEVGRISHIVTHRCWSCRITVACDWLWLCWHLSLHVGTFPIQTHDCPVADALFTAAAQNQFVIRKSFLFSLSNYRRMPSFDHVSTRQHRAVTCVPAICQSPPPLPALFPSPCS